MKKELSMIAVRGLPISWENFMRGLSSWPKLPKFESLKNECTQEDSRLIMRGIVWNQEGEFQALQVSTNNKGKIKRENFKLFKLVPIIKEKEREFIKTTRKSTNHTRKGIGPKYNASNVTNSVTFITSVQNGRIYK